MNQRSKSIWKEHLPIHLFFLVIALVGFWKVGTLWGFVILGVSLGGTGIVFVLEKKIIASRNRTNDEQS